MANESWTSERRTARQEALNLEHDRTVNARRDAKLWAEVDAMAAEEEERRTTRTKLELTDENFGARVPAPDAEGWDWFEAEHDNQQYVRTVRRLSEMWTLIPGRPHLAGAPSGHLTPVSAVA